MSVCGTLCGTRAQKPPLLTDAAGNPAPAHPASPQLGRFVTLGLRRSRRPAPLRALAVAAMVRMGVGGGNVCLKGRENGRLGRAQKILKTVRYNSCTTYPYTSANEGTRRHREGCACRRRRRIDLRIWRASLTDTCVNPKRPASNPWQQEIRDYLRSGKMPTLFARNNLAAWGRRTGLLKQAPARLSHLQLRFSARRLTKPD